MVLTTTRSLPYLFSLNEIVYNRTHRKDSNLRHIVATALQAVALHNDNFPSSLNAFRIYKLKFNLRKFFRLINPPDASLISSLDYLFEIIESQYYVRKSLNISLADAVRTYETLIHAKS